MLHTLGSFRACQEMSGCCPHDLTYWIGNAVGVHAALCNVAQHCKPEWEPAMRWGAHAVHLVALMKR